ncbi:MAG: isopentenyl-diphosphate Delta-isomerase [Verrucomicrobia bacterium]|nr:isopentenyl-diphosphate Delta-isomerase [Verrucomicrobiota bacterium]
MAEEERVVLVDEFDNEIGQSGKLQAHIEGKLHRAISVFLFNDKGQMLLQQRALSKYHSGGLWTNTCCSHPRPGESNLDAAERRLGEEMGIRCKLEKVFDFTYKAYLDKNLTEYEFDHVFFGKFNDEPQLNPDEASDWKWIGLEDLERDVAIHPERYTAWFKIILKRVLESAYSLS